MGEGVGDGALHKTLGGSLERGGRGEERVEGGEGAEEALLFLGPGERLGGAPCGIALRNRERPMEEVAHVGKNLDGLAARAIESAEGSGGVFESADGAVSESGESVAKEIAFFVHAGNIAHRPTEGEGAMMAGGRRRAEIRPRSGMFDRLNFLRRFQRIVAMEEP